MPLQPRTPPRKKEADEASRNEMEQKALEQCAQLMTSLRACAPRGIHLYQTLWKCRKQRAAMEICLGQLGKNEAVLEKIKRDYRLHPDELE